MTTNLKEMQIFVKKYMLNKQKKNCKIAVSRKEVRRGILATR
jgi:hypothetical protein